MDSKKLNKLCGEAKIRASKAYTQVGFALYRTTDKEKLQALKAVILCINDLEEIKEQIENEISITKEDATEELECSKNYILSTSECIGKSIKYAISGNSNAEMIKYINNAIYGLDCLNENRGYLETLRERLNLEEQENDNQ